MGAFIDFTGQKFGSMTVISFSKISDKKRTYWNCKCDCGTEKEVWAGYLRQTKSCGKKDCMSPTNIHKLTGQRFGFLVALIYVIRQGWMCQCDCGKIHYVRGDALIKGHTKSCGCKTGELNAAHHILPNNAAAFNKLYSIYSNGAKNRNYEFILSIEQLKELVLGNCFYCGTPPYNSKIISKSNEKFRYNGIDRINNEFGYVMKNIVSCCALCNMAKRDMSYEDFIAWLDRISNYRKNNDKTI